MATDIFHPLIDSLSGIAYAVDRAGTLVAVSRRNWDEFARHNKGEDIAATDVILNKPLLDFVAGENVRDFYAQSLEAVMSGQKNEIVLAANCSSPHIKRETRLSLTPVLKNGEIVGALFQSTVLKENEQPPMNLYDFKANAAHYAQRTNIPLLAMCSTCQRVRHPAGSKEETGRWVEPEDFYRLGGKSEVRISHSICSSCLPKMMQNLH